MHILNMYYKLENEVKERTGRRCKMEHLAVLFYLNGNNELEPEVWKSFLKLSLSADSPNMTVLAQVARQNSEITEFMRLGYKYHIFEEQWSGIRRYIIKNKKYIQIPTPEITNMASPQTLYDFIVWAQTNYPANKYILILGGHAYQFIGISPDFSCDQPYLLGFSELSFALWKAQEDTQKQIDLLVFDTCYASSFETLYELVNYPLPVAKYMMTYIGGGPLKGLPYDLLIEIIKDSIINPVINITKIIENIIYTLPQKKFSYPLIGFILEKELIYFCKQKINDMARQYLEIQDKYDIMTPFEVITADNSYPWYAHIQMFYEAAKKIIMAKTSKEFYDNDILPIHIMYKKIPDKERKQQYQRLAFCQNNAWCEFVCGTEEIENSYKKDIIQPLPISPNVLQSFVSNMNQHVSLEMQFQLKDKLIQMKQWKFPEDSENAFVRKKPRIAYILPHCHLTGGMKMLLQQMRLLKSRGYIIYAVFRSDEPVNIDWSHLDVEEQIVVPNNEKMEDYLPECDVISAGWFAQLPELVNIDIPIFYWEQGHESLFGDIPKEYSPDFINRFMHVCYKLPCYMYSVSKYVSDIIESKFGVKTQVLTNCIDTSIYHPGKHKEDDMILFVGNPHLLFKGFPIAIAALNIVWRLGYKFRVKWACQEEPRSTANILFPVEIIIKPEQTELAELYRSAAIHVFASWYEGFGMPPLEAMASGTAVVCTDCGGVREYIIEGYNALIVPPGDIEELAANVILLLKNIELRKKIEKNAIESVKKFDSSMKIDELEQAFMYVLSQQQLS